MAFLATSRYSFSVPLSDGSGLFNGSTGGVVRLRGADAAELATLLSGPRTLIPAEALDEVLVARLRRGGFLIDPDLDEVAVVRERYWAARGKAQVVLLVTTTMDCNLGCYYCYESRSPAALQVSDSDQLVEIARSRLRRGDKHSLHVDWYGGEPLMNIEFLESASAALQSFCAAEAVAYHASVISNGTQWPQDVGAFVARHKIREVQISFDGLKANHDDRRRYRPRYRPDGDASSFDRAVALVDGLLAHTRVDVRFNADPGNADDFEPIIDFAARRGWFDAPFRCMVMVAKLSAYSDRSAFMRRKELDQERFEALQEIARDKLPREAKEDMDVAGGFPGPMTSVCGALASDSVVVGADGREYRCGLQVSEPQRAVGRFMGEGPTDESFPDRSWWESFDPTVLPSCSRCSFLPLCWGGCAKRHLDGSRLDVEAEGRFWRRNLPRMIVAGFDEDAPPGLSYGEADQFRSGPAPEPE